jgi:hypothetical protein
MPRRTIRHDGVLESDYGLAKRSDVSAEGSGLKADSVTAKSSGRCASFGTHFRPATEIPALVVDVHRRHFLRGKGNFLEPSDFDNAAFAGDDLIEGSSVAEFHRYYLIAYACLSGSLQVIDKTARYWN